VVDGSGDTDVFAISREKPRRILRKEIGKKIISVETKSAQALSNGPSLTEERALELAELALALEEHFGDAQDIEWALKPDGSMVILQSRPLMTGDAANDSLKTAYKETEGLKVLLKCGVTASKGIACGPVFKTANAIEKSGFPKGSILVIEQALPHWASLLSKAAGIISEQGGIACHLANVAREFKVPALFDVPEATKSLMEKQWITLDADNKAVYEGKIELFKHEPKRIYDILESPVHKSLKRAAEYITPLRLLDPDSPDFRPENCGTLHDLTRFCHEKANKEMFKFGIDHKFPEKASRRLFTDVATQFWVIDLDDGLVEHADDPYFIRLEEIVSMPMLALWAGMQLIPWEGPPPVDALGFFQVLAGSTMDPNLNLSAPSEHAEGSYFMISKNYCSLQSKFGFHFALVEALVSERTIENYIKFQFNGGGASIERQSRRISLVADILQEKGFRAHVKQDSLDARIEGHDKHRMEQALATIGYLLVHTRQLDMVMADSEAVSRYRLKMLKDLEKLPSET
jgi:pyruvate,water dikinase